SDVACATLTEMDLSAVRSAADVVAVICADDLPFANDVSPSVHDEPLLADGQVEYFGQPLFLVVAKTHLAARKAARLGKISYDEKPALLSIEDALAADSRFEEGPRVYQKGDALKAISGAKHQLKGRLEIGGQEHFYLEGQAALAIPQEDREMVVHSSTQHPSEIQHKVAEALGLGLQDVRVEVRRMGGGFGGKESQGNALAVACAVAAQMTNAPCKMRYDRDDDMMITGKRHDFRIEYAAGFDDDGRLSGVNFVHYARCGWAQDLSLPVADRAMLHADNAYHLPHCRIESHRLKTNTQSATAFRGFGGPQGMLGIERLMDHVAHHLGVDPLTIRQRNYYRDAKASNLAAPAAHRAVQTTPYGMEVKDFILNEMTEALAESSDYHARRAALRKWNASSRILKKGLALAPVKFGISFTLSHLNQAGALVHVYQDGTIRMNHGGTEMGQGLFQKVAQVAAQCFGVSIEQIKITATDTAKVPNTSATAASSGSDLNGMAVKQACDVISGRMAEFLAQKYQTTVQDIRFQDGAVHIGAMQLSFAEACKICYENRISLSSTGFYKTPDLSWDRIKGSGRPFYYFAYGVAVSEVVIDTLTGENRILRADILHDVGSSLNPALDIGQIEGGYVQGAGWLTTEELVWNPKGKLLTHAPSTYKIPAISDRPDIFNVALWNAPNSEQTIYRSKAVGEPPLMLGISVLMALSDALLNCGKSYPALDAPATAEQILMSIERMRHGV
ncbi:MAG: xanthine dehydrogenase molybdopterin binding subunit, partial [Paracoccaceae bacterium]